jgi:8-oxo-dGTP pyrophosphatase MutT (NUDIX family)
VPLFLAEAKDMNVKLSREHTEYKWLGFDEAYNMIFLFTQKEMLQYVNLFLNNNEYFKTLTEIKL